MKRFHETLAPLKRGLRRSPQAIINSFDLVELKNLEPTPEGLVPYHPVEQAISYGDLAAGGLIEDFPFPQLFIGKRYVVLAGSSKIYLVNRYDFSQPLIELATYDADNPSSTTTINEGGAWHFVDMQDSWILYNGTSLVLYTGKETMVGDSLKVYVKNNVNIEAMAYWRGRIVMGGFDPTTFWSSDWESFWNTWVKKVTDTGIATYFPYEGSNVLMPMQENFIWYSQIDAGDFLFLFFPTLVNEGYLSTTYDSSKPYFFDLLKRGDSGWMALDGKGKVRELIPLGDYLIAYLDEGVVALVNMVDPDPHLGQKKIYDFGVKGHAAAGNENVNVFIDKGGNLVVLDASLKSKVEGYAEFLKPLREQEISAYYSPDPRDLTGFGLFYFCLSDQAYIYNGELFWTEQVIRSVAYHEGATMGIVDYYSDEAYFTLDVADFGDRGIKQLDSFQVAYREKDRGDEEPPHLSLSVYYRFKVNEDFSQTSYVQLNNNGEVYLPVSSITFKFKVRIDDYERIERIWSVTPVIKFTDRRFRRSVAFSQVAGESSGR